MLAISIRKSLFAVGVVSALIPMLLSAAPTEPSKSNPSLSPPEKVRRDLEQTVTLTEQFKPDQRVTLSEVLDYLHKKAKLNFEIDERAFGEVGLKDVESTPINGSDLIDGKIKDVLRRVLGRIPVAPTDAHYLVLGDTVLITTEAFSPYRWMHQRVNVDCEKEDLATVMKKLASETGASLVIDARAAKEGQTLLTVRLLDVSLDTAVYLLAEMAGLRPVRVGNVLFLTAKENVRDIRNDPDRQFVTGPCPQPPLGVPAAMAAPQ
jgi:hypothetical protein